MTNAPSIPSASGRVILATVLLAALVSAAGCSTDGEYTTSIGGPTNGTVIDGLSVYDIDEMDGARYELQYSLDASDDASYDIEVYELANDSREFVSISDLDRREPVHRNDVPPPWDDGEERRYELRVVHQADGDVVDAVTFTVKRESD